VAPVVEELVPVPDPVRSCELLNDLPYRLFLDSAAQGPRLGRYSFLTADPVAVVWSKGSRTECIDFYGLEGTRHAVDGDALDAIRTLLAPHTAEPVPGLPPFQGGAAGYLADDWWDTSLALRSSFTHSGYLAAVARVREYIFAGDIFQANLSQRFEAPLDEPTWTLYRRLRTRNAAPFAAYLDFPDGVVLSASPERFLRVDVGGHVETRPIKGTRPRGVGPEHDSALGVALALSAKDQAENLMIVDLMRNDLSRVCAPGTVRVAELFGLEHYATVHHLVSTVIGDLTPGTDGLALLRASFPGGSITGAPKIRAMEIITELEPSERGVYCGSIG